MSAIDIFFLKCEVENFENKEIPVHDDDVN